METNESFLFKEECYQIIGCCMEVQKELGHGFLEPVYQEALALVFLEKGILFEREKLFSTSFQGQSPFKKIFCRLFLL